MAALWQVFDQLEPVYCYCQISPCSRDSTLLIDIFLVIYVSTCNRAVKVCFITALLRIWSSSMSYRDVKGLDQVVSLCWSCVCGRTTSMLGNKTNPNRSSKRQITIGCWVNSPGRGRISVLRMAVRACNRYSPCCAVNCSRVCWPVQCSDPVSIESEIVTV